MIMTAMTISLPEEMLAPVKRAVAAGEYSSSSEILREALRAWTKKRAREESEAAAERDAA
jgi:antitoxin ParD1/3/4